MTPAELESLALHYRAECGVIPYRVFVALEPEARNRLAMTSQTKAQRDLRALSAGNPPAPPRTIHLTTRADEAAMAELARHIPREPDR